MKLALLLDNEVEAPADAEGLDILGLSADSRAISCGYVFAALPGVKADGSRFIAQAVLNGACAVLVDRDAVIDEMSVPVPVLRSCVPRRALAKMAARFFGTQPSCAVAVTGTSGKTSVVDFTRQIFAAQGFNAASVGTIGIVKPDGKTYGSLTTPDPVSLHETLKDLASEGVTHLAFEASSHGLSQYRLDGVTLRAGAFTNLGRDHLDYHDSLDDYFGAKMRLFRDLLEPGQPAVINLDGAGSVKALACATACGLKCLTVGRNGETVQLVQSQDDGFVQRLRLAIGETAFDVTLPLVGAYQVENALVALGLAIATGCDTHTSVEALSTLKGVKGRLEIVGEARRGLAIVDYAHKPDALKAALAAVRPFVSGRLICVFGCGGDRDRGKRPIMGEIAAEMCDVVIVTDDNPRNEDPASIRAEILKTAQGAREIGNRGDAIRAAINMMGSGDVVVVAGKGHETGQIVGDVVTPFSDHEEMALALASVS